MRKLEQFFQVLQQTFGIVAGVILSEIIFKKVDQSLSVDLKIKDGDQMKIGDIGLVVEGNAQVKEFRYLSGTGSDQTVQWDFFCTTGRKSGYWTKIDVPSCWEQQGFGGYNYGRDYKTYGKNFRFNEEKVMYKYSFTIPADWKGKEVFLVFEGSMTDTEVKINGRSAGALHQGAFYRFRYNITDKLLMGKPNLLEVTVSKMSSEPSVNNA